MSQSSRTDAVPVEPEERRTRDRYTCDLKSSCKPIEAQTATAWPAKIRDVSATGVRLMMFRRFEPGTLLVLELQDTTGAARMFLACVVRVARQMRGRWSLGCALDVELDDKDLEALVETPYTAWIQEQPATQNQGRDEAPQRRPAAETQSAAEEDQEQPSTQDMSGATQDTVSMENTGQPMQSSDTENIGVAGTVTEHKTDNMIVAAMDMESAPKAVVEEGSHQVN